MLRKDRLSLYMISCIFVDGGEGNEVGFMRALLTWYGSKKLELTRCQLMGSSHRFKRNLRVLLVQSYTMYVGCSNSVGFNFQIGWKVTLPGSFGARILLGQNKNYLKSSLNCCIIFFFSSPIAQFSFLIYLKKIKVNGVLWLRKQ